MVKQLPTEVIRLTIMTVHSLEANKPFDVDVEIDQTMEVGGDECHHDRRAIANETTEDWCDQSYLLVFLVVRLENEP